MATCCVLPDTPHPTPYTLTQKKTLRAVRAMATRCFSPPLSLRPRSPTMVLSPLGSCSRMGSTAAIFRACLQFACDSGQLVCINHHYRRPRPSESRFFKSLRVRASILPCKSSSAFGPTYICVCACALYIPDVIIGSVFAAITHIVLKSLVE